ncbi:MAG: hypothetical protein KJ799_11460 [Bacteroidetes bacterium]|nr:hypothetical protein [Bacteroidota bacterium]MBU1679950.1 hypothetical protein [Bacteroidota bacterium]MBU2507325.1 hypothetical protein [Bacteroidota bacterium]
MKKIIFYSALIISSILFTWHCSRESNPLLPVENNFNGNLEIKTEKSEYFIESVSSKIEIFVLATVLNTSQDTFYSDLGDGFLAGIDHDNLLIAKGTDGYIEKNISDNNWKQLDRLMLYEGSKVIRILPAMKYNLHATSIVDSNSYGKCRVRIDYYKKYSKTEVDTLRDTSNTFSILKGKK